MQLRFMEVVKEILQVVRGQPAVAILITALEHELDPLPELA